MNKDANLINKNYWSSKPYWCQPWSIILTGIIITLFSWLFFNNLLFTFITITFILIWWVIFLYYAPKNYDEYLSINTSMDES